MLHRVSISMVQPMRARLFARPRARALKDAWHACDRAEVLSELSSRADGLEAAEVERARRRWGENVLGEERPRSPLALVLAQLANLPSALLLGSGGLSTLLGEFVDAAAIGTVLGLNTAIGVS